MKTDPNEPSFPVPYEIFAQLPSGHPCFGLTKRELFAGEAMKGLLSHGIVEFAALEAVKKADELIAALNQP